MYSNPTSISRDGLVAEYLLDGDARDTSGNNNHWTASNFSWVDSEKGYVKKCGSFNWNNAYIYVSNFDFFWDNSAFSIHSYETNKTLSHYIVNQWYHQPNIDIIEENKWYFFVNIYNSQTNKTKCYLNNNLVATFNKAYSTNKSLCWWIFLGDLSNVNRRRIFNRNSSNDFRIWNLQSPDTLYKGKMWILRFYDKILTQKEIQTLYLEWERKLWPWIFQVETGFPKYTPLSLPRPILHYDWTIAWNQVIDQSGNGNNGTITWTIETGKVGKHKYMRNTSGYTILDKNKFKYRLHWCKQTTYSIIFKRSSIWSQWWFLYARANNKALVQIWFQDNNTITIWWRSQNWDSFQVLEWKIITDTSNYYNLHIIFDYENDKIIYYLNWLKEKEQSVSFGSDTFLNISNLDYIYFLSMMTNGRYFKWDIVNFSIYDKALTDEQILQDYYANKI